MAAISSSDLTAALKELYVGQKMQELVFNAKSRPFMSKVKKDGSFQGETKPLPIMYEDVAGGSYTFSKAQENVGSMQLVTFQIDVKDYFRVVQVNTKALRRNKSDVGSFLKQQTIKYDSAINALSNDIEQSLFRTSAGYRGIIDSTVDTGTLVIPFANEGDAKRFAVGDQVVVADTPTSALRTGVGTVTKTDYANNEITISGFADLATNSWQAGDYVWREGDYVSSSDRLAISGLEDWIPTTVASDDSFFGVNRYSQRERLAGLYKSDGDLTNIEQSILAGATDLADISGAAPDICFVNHPLWALLAKEMNVDVRRKPLDGTGGMESLSVYGPMGEIKVVPATYCQENRGWLLEMSSWCLESMGDPVGIYSDDGQMAQRVYNADALETRINSYPQLSCNRPAHNMRIDFS